MKSDLLAQGKRTRLLYARMFTDAAARYRLSQTEIDVLLFLVNHPDENTARDIVSQRGLAKSNVSTAVEALRQKGYLDVRGDPDSRRVHRLLLLPKSEELTRELRICQAHFFDIIFRGISQQELDTFQQTLCRIDENTNAELRRRELSDE